MQLLHERYSGKIKGLLSCFDRVVITGTLPRFCYAGGMAQVMSEYNIRLFDYTKFVEPMRDEIRRNAENIAKENDLKIDFIRKKNFRKEARIKKILEKRGNHPGLVHIFSAMEPCSSYRPWHDKKTHLTYLKSVGGKCLHYYFYFIDEELGLCYVRIPTWSPFRLQIYFNGHNLLANQMQKNGIHFEMIENAFIEIDDFDKAQELVNSFSTTIIHRKLDYYAKLLCPIVKRFYLSYHWSIMQVEYATDIIFKSQKNLKTIYENISRTAIHAVKADNIATFLGRKLHGNYQDEMGNDFSTRIEGTRIKHSMGKVSIKMYDKFSLVLRIETTVNDVSFFKHYRTVEHRDGSVSTQLANMKKEIYSLSPLREHLEKANMRYIEFISALDDREVEMKNLGKISERVVKDNRSYKGLNLFSEEDLKILEAVACGEFNIHGFQNKNLSQKLESKTSSQVSRIIKRLRVHGLIRKISGTYRYHLTKLGKAVIILGLKLKDMVVIPNLSLKSVT